MSTTLVSIEEYLDTSYSPDREYVDGVVMERNLGERSHSRVQHILSLLLAQQAPSLFVWPEQRVRTRPTRSRVPDVCITETDPGTDVFLDPPLICIEILSRRDEVSRVLEKLEEYVAFGVREIWLIDPRRFKLYTYQTALVEVPALTLPSYGIELTPDAVFDGLAPRT